MRTWLHTQRASLTSAGEPDLDLDDILYSADMYHRVRQLKEEPYSQKEAEAAAGLTWTDNGKRKIRKSKTIPLHL